MRVLIPGQSYPQKVALLDPDETLAVRVVGQDGETLEAPTVGTVTTSAVLEAAAVPGDMMLKLAAPAAPELGWYLPVSAWGESPVEIIVYDATALRAYLREPVLVHLPAGTELEPITAQFSVTVPGTYAGDVVYIETTSALRSRRDAYLVNAFEFVSPFDLFREIPRLQGQQLNRPDILEVPARAVEDLRGRLWGDGIKLDNCQIPSRCLPFLRSWVKAYLTEQGIDVVGGDVDRLEALAKFERDVNAEYKILVGAKIWQAASDVAGNPRRAGWRARV